MKSITFQAKCSTCSRTFPTTASLRKHRVSKHRTLRRWTRWPTFCDGKGKEMVIPKPRKVHQKKMAEYSSWLEMVVDRFNNLLHPKAKGKWVTLDLYCVPLSFFKHLLSKTKCFPHNVKETSHLRAPMIAESSLRISYRTNDISLVLTALNEQNNLPVQNKKVHGNDQEQENLSANDALAWAKSRAAEGSQSYILKTRRISEVEISEPSREFEIIWWPNLYTNSNYGKLTLRLFVQKTSL